MERPLSLNEIQRRTGISYPALLRYRDQMLTGTEKSGFSGPLAKFVVMKGTHVRFDAAAIPLFFRAKKAGLARRGRPPVPKKKAKRR